MAIDPRRIAIVLCIAALPCSAQQIDVGGIGYTLGQVTGFSPNAALLEVQPWWGSSAAAANFAGAAAAAGAPAQNASRINFAYAIQGTAVWYVASQRDAQGVLGDDPMPLATSPDTLAWEIATTLKSSSSGYVVPTGPDPASTQAALVATAAALQEPFAVLGEELVDRLGADCDRFDNAGICLSEVASSVGLLGVDPGQRSARLVAAWRARTGLRIGAWVEQPASTAASGGIVAWGAAKPGFGLFAARGPAAGAAGYTLRLALGSAAQSLGITRPVLGPGEAGSGLSTLELRGATVEVGVELPLRGGWTASPRAGLREVGETLAGYSESAAVSRPLSYAPLTQSDSTALTGLRLAGPLHGRLGGRAEFDVERDLADRSAVLSAGGLPGLDVVSLAPARRLLRAGVAMGADYPVGPGRVALDLALRQQPYPSNLGLVASLSYTAGF